jgi:hypothetical protein
VSRALAALLCLLLCAPARAADDDVRLRRFGLMVGVNDGGTGRPLLRYAVSDARSVERVLRTLGGVAPRDVVFVQDAGRAGLLDAFARVRRLAATAPAGVRRELVVYYSGHSDDEGLLLGGERVSYAELRGQIQAVPADVRVAILDSCASGAFTRRKGGVRRPPFLHDNATDLRGHAFLTSSAADEVAQESDRIAASFFTHFFVSGLRGAADVDGDRRVTLQEAYQFASQETLARTERTSGGPQHAAYEFDLAGTGELVVTDVRAPQATLVLGPDLGGRIVVRAADGALVAEMRKSPGRAVELGLEAGRYHVGAEDREADVALASGQRVTVSAPSLRAGPARERAVSRGGAAARVSVHGAIVGTEASRRTAVDHFAGGLVVGDVASVGGVQVAGVVGRAGRLDGVQVAPVALAGGGDGVQVGAATVGEADIAAQVGAVNIAGDVSTLQVGLVNVAGRHRGEALGLISIVPDGIHEVAVAITDTFPLQVSLKTGARHLYTALSYDWAPGENPLFGRDRLLRRDARMGVGAAVGWRFAIESGGARFVEVEAGTTRAFRADAWSEAGWLWHLRSQVGVPLWDRLTVVGGAGLSLADAAELRTLDVSVFGVQWHGLTPSATVGLQY